jgi:hypothetical protein
MDLSHLNLSAMWLDFLPYMGSVIGGYMMIRMAFVEKKLGTRFILVVVGIILESLSIGFDVYAAAIHPDPKTTNDIMLFMVAPIILGVSSSFIQGGITKGIEKILGRKDEDE